MGMLDKLIGRKKRIADETLAAAEGAPCPHITLIPKWDSTTDMGHEDKVSGYTCDSCKRAFTAAEGRDLRRTEAERVRHELET